MRYLRLTNATYELLGQQVLPGYTMAQISTRLSNGDWNVPVDDEVYDRINRMRLLDETDDEVVERVIHLAKGVVN